jgi:hypothetical protein
VVVVVGRFWVDIVEEGGWEAGNRHYKVRLGTILGEHTLDKRQLELGGLCTSLRWESGPIM